MLLVQLLGETGRLLQRLNPASRFRVSRALWQRILRNRGNGDAFIESGEHGLDPIDAVRPAALEVAVQRRIDERLRFIDRLEINGGLRGQLPRFRLWQRFA